MNKTKNYDCIDILKMIASVMIFTMHFNAFKNFGKMSFLFEILSRWAIPFFFIASSYFLHQTSDNSIISKEALMKYISRIFSLYFVWFIINLPSIFFIRLYGENLTSLKIWGKFLFNSIISSTFTGSWYLNSCLFCALIFYCFEKTKRKGLLLFISAFTQVICILSSAYHGVLLNIPLKIIDFLHFPLNIFGGMFYFYLGHLIYEKQEILMNYSKRIFLILSALFYFLYGLEIYLTRHYNIYKSSDQAFLIVPFSFFFFCLVLNMSTSFKHSKVCRNISTIVYCAQSNIIVLSRWFCKKLNITSSLLIYLLGCFIMFLSVFFIMYVKNKKSSTIINHMV